MIMSTETLSMVGSVTSVVDDSQSSGVVCCWGVWGATVRAQGLLITNPWIGLV